MNSKLNNNIGYTWLCQVTQKLYEQGTITKDQQEKNQCIKRRKN